ncbi:hypothetical protein [Bartonella pachyuromydis]|uniref:hypothetical protein n=1 Tax=Bartonella pachyuromydis TaxID=931097 RepID=UPI0031E76E03
MLLPWQKWWLRGHGVGDVAPARFVVIMLSRFFAYRYAFVYSTFVDFIGAFTEKIFSRERSNKIKGMVRHWLFHGNLWNIVLILLCCFYQGMKFSLCGEKEQKAC